MAEFGGFPALGFLVLFSVFASCVVSRTHLITSGTEILDVDSAISKTRDVFSVNSDKVQALKQDVHERNGAVLSFTLHTRLSIRGGADNDYHSLTLARLGRDSVRVEAIQTRVDLASYGVRKADLMPMADSELAEEKLEGPVVSGTSQGSGEYFCRVGIGKPATQAYMVLDTGSDVNWVQCAPCADCYQQADPIFDPDLSSSFSSLNCETQQCKSLEVSECRNNTCLYEVSYGDGSYTVGDFATETITLGGSAAVNNVAIGCGHNNEGLFVAAAGLIGLGGGKLSFPSQINATSFSYCLVDRDSDSASTLDFNSPLPPDAVTAPLRRNSKLDTFYYIDLTGIKVSGELLPLPPTTFQLNANGSGGVILDSGTAVTRLPTAVYASLRDAFKKGTKDLRPAGGVALFDTCYDLRSKKSVEVPTVSFQFSNGKELGLPAKNYMIPVDSSGTFCLAFAPTASSPGIVGNVQQQGTRVSYDLANSLIGFSPSKC
ncbi:protein ASPARTIC PROTEASE IN GUARD CELL 1-like [Andrographis paniculata]|uniref:protein ASPARTIC PROTEASE IN GUARD CELL 1-like n=1 Tax=Andrographis paniculata TaxID=175694 RepID=UPI0021E98D20|nr:protein ASPARTIC PROTEASE IN GUARD CELL 1-like [Andrographis paniculata]